MDTLQRLIATQGLIRRLEVRLERLRAMRDRELYDYVQDRSVNRAQVARDLRLTPARMYVVLADESDRRAADDESLLWHLRDEHTQQLWDEAQAAWRADGEHGSVEEYFPLEWLDVAI